MLDKHFCPDTITVETHITTTLDLQYKHWATEELCPLPPPTKLGLDNVLALRLVSPVSSIYILNSWICLPPN